MRDGDDARYGGKGVLKAVEVVTQRFASQLEGLRADDQAAIDEVLQEAAGGRCVDARGLCGRRALSF